MEDMAIVSGFLMYKLSTIMCLYLSYQKIADCTTYRCDHHKKYNKNYNCRAEMRERRAKHSEILYIEILYCCTCPQGIKENVCKHALNRNAGERVPSTSK